MSLSRIVRGATLRSVPWRNGKGTTRDVLTAPGGLTDWQISIADLATDAPFSDFSGMDRTFTIIEGSGVELSFGAIAVPCPPLVPIRFAGGAAPACRLIDGPGRAFNLFVDARRFRSRVAVLRVAPDCTLEIEDGTTALHCLDGALQVGDEALRAGDTLVDGRGTIRTNGGAVTLLGVMVATRLGGAPDPTSA